MDTLRLSITHPCARVVTRTEFPVNDLAVVLGLREFAKDARPLPAYRRTGTVGMNTDTKTWTAEQVLALGVRTDLVTACRIVYGVGKNKAWEMFHAGELDFPALRCGRRVVCPTAPLRALLGLTREAA